MLKNSALGLCLLLAACAPASALGPADTPTAWPGKTETYVFFLTELAPGGHTPAPATQVPATAAPTDNASVGVVAEATATAAPALGMTLPEFVKKFDSLTDLQKAGFIDDVKGKTVDWRGTVLQVSGDGSITMNIPNTLLSTISLADVPTDVAATLNKDASIRVTGTIDDVIDLLGLHIYLVNCAVTK